MNQRITIKPFVPGDKGAVCKAGYLARCGCCANWHDLDVPTMRSAKRELSRRGWRKTKEAGLVCFNCLVAHGYVDGESTTIQARIEAHQHSAEEGKRK